MGLILLLGVAGLMMFVPAREEDGVSLEPRPVEVLKGLQEAGEGVKVRFLVLGM